VDRIKSAYNTVRVCSGQYFGTIELEKHATTADDGLKFVAISASENCDRQMLSGRCSGQRLRKV
jgi:hypothetical protein